MTRDPASPLAIQSSGSISIAVRWFPRLSGGPLDYDRWCAALPGPLTPAVLRGATLNHAARRRAGLDETFLAALEAEPPATAPRRRP